MTAATATTTEATNTNIATLQRWTQQGILPQVVFSDQDNALHYQDTSIPANAPLTIHHQNKYCTYSTASLFLQLLHPGLIQYRHACKKHNVLDPVKATDKVLVVAVFPVTVGATREEAMPVTTTTTTTDKQPQRLLPPHKKARKDKHNNSSSNNNKQPKPLVTNEQLFDRLNVVVDKRQQPVQVQQEENANHNSQQQQQHMTTRITKALCADGFAVTPELLKEHGPRTELILQQEIPVGNSASILRAINPQKDLSRVLELFQEATKRTSSSTSALHHSKPSSTPLAKPIRTHLIGQKPVILVPKGMTAPLTMVNAHEFLANAKYVPRETMVQQNKHRNPLTTFTRRHDHTNSTNNSSNSSSSNNGQRWMEYEIMDNPRKLGTTQAAWDRVVAVIVLGQSWQFKDWLKGYQAPATLFDQVYGFFLSMEGDQLPPEVSTWAVQLATLNRDKRGLDQVAYATFWNGLEEFIRVRKPELLL